MVSKIEKEKLAQARKFVIDDAPKIPSRSKEENEELMEKYHMGSKCPKTGKPFNNVQGRYVNTIGKSGYLSGGSGHQTVCSECGSVTGTMYDTRS